MLEKDWEDGGVGVEPSAVPWLRCKDIGKGCSFAKGAAKLTDLRGPIAGEMTVVCCGVAFVGPGALASEMLPVVSLL